MKITIITPVFPYPIKGVLHGLERYIENIAINLKNLGNEVKILTTFWNGGLRHDYYKGIPILRILDSKSLLGKFGSLFYLNSLTFNFNLFRKKNYQFYYQSDLIILSWAIPFSGFFKLKKIPVISIFYHYDHSKVLNDYLTYPFLHIFQKRQFKTHKHLITISEASKKDLIKYYKLDKDNIYVIATGFESQRFNPSNYSEIIRNKFGNKILLFTGFMIYRKRIPILLLAMSYVLKKIPEVHLILIGNGPLWNDLIKISEKLEIKKNVSFLGFIEDKLLGKYYATADIYILPSEQEGFGQVIIEAMASGTPVICVKKPPMSEILEDGGLTFSLNDPIDLSKKIIELLNNPELLANKRTKAIKIVEKYHWKYIIKKYDRIFHQIIKNK